TYDDKTFIQEAMQAGADGYVLKCVEVAELIRIMNAFCNESQAVSPYLVNLSLDFKATRKTPEEVRELEDQVLTYREK
ncbi:MAG: DNA-binding response regulator, partial [Deltaproteobacteria bacterium]|nr:DNA-binding response regulator [Deltaproteobacteria bacterium]